MKRIRLLKENEIDTVLFSVFEIFEYGKEKENWNICLCNPPGGDWSRIQFKDFTINKTFTWNTLPRVRGKEKLPDFVVQYHRNKDLIFSIESKDNPTNLEINIGERMNNFMKWIFSEVDPSFNSLSDSKNEKFVKENFEFISCVASSFNPEQSQSKVQDLFNKCNCDFIFNFIANEKIILYEIFTNDLEVSKRYFPLMEQRFNQVSLKSNLRSNF